MRLIGGLRPQPGDNGEMLGDLGRHSWVNARPVYPVQCLADWRRDASCCGRERLEEPRAPPLASSRIGARRSRPWLVPLPANQARRPDGARFCDLVSHRALRLRFVWTESRRTCDYTGPFSHRRGRAYLRELKAPSGRVKKLFHSNIRSLAIFHHGDFKSPPPSAGSNPPLLGAINEGWARGKKRPRVLAERVVAGQCCLHPAIGISTIG